MFSIVFGTTHITFWFYYFVQSFFQVATSLNSYDCFLLQSGTSMFLWHGNQSTHEQQELAAKVAEFLKVVSNGIIFDFSLAESFPSRGCTNSYEAYKSKFPSYHGSLK